MPEPLIVVEGVTKRFGGAVALDGVSAALGAGITGLVGPDGAGKTTLLRLIAGLLRPDAGRIAVLGHDSVTAARAYQGEIGYMPQRFGLYDDLTVAENLRLTADLHELDAAARAARLPELLAFTALAPFTGRLAGKLSGGMKQKLGLACALLARPRLLLLDEPSVGVDPVSRRDLWAIVGRLIGEGVAVLWSTAYLDEAERCDRVLLLQEGRLLGDGPPAGFTRAVAGRIFRLAVPAELRRPAQRRAERHPDVADALIQGSSLRLVLRPGAAPPEPALLLPPGAEAAAARLQPAAPRFEDAFVALLREAPAAAGPPTPAPPAPAPPAAVTAAPAAGAAGPVIEAHALSRRFGSFRAVDALTLSVRRGEIFGLLGPNGAGKSTTFRMLCGLLPPSGGTARVAGVDLGRAPADARARIGYMAQRFALYGGLTVRQNLDFFAGAYGLSGARRRQRRDWVVESFGLAPYLDGNSGELPLGFKQRLALGCALIHEPGILFLDEPTSGVDPLTRREFWNRIGDLADDGVTVLVTSHFMDEAEYCDRLAVIYRGRLIALGTPDAIKRDQATAEAPDPSLDDAFVGLIGAWDRTHPA
ncbi:MAG: ATP-binding cassette domain-containing protein [Dongiaceae bacterium]